MIAGTLTASRSEAFMVAAFAEPQGSRTFEDLPPHLQLSPWFLGSVHEAVGNIRRLMSQDAAPIAIAVEPEELISADELTQFGLLATPRSLLAGLRLKIRGAVLDSGAMTLESSAESIRNIGKTYLENAQTRANTVSRFILERVALVQDTRGTFHVRSYIPLQKRLSREEMRNTQVETQ